MPDHLEGDKMADRTGASPRTGWRARRGLALVASAAVLTAITGCGDDDSSDSGSTESMDSGERAELLGPENRATGEPVRVGIISDGATPAYDTTDEIRAAQATADYWNEHRSGIGGRPIELVTCETGGEPAGATDCGNQMVEENAVAVVFSNSGVGDSAWGPLHEAGIPTMYFQTTGDELTRDAQSTFTLVNPLPAVFGLPVAVAEREDADKVAFVVIDVPVAVEAFESNGQQILDNAGLDHELVRVPPGTADMTPQMQEVVDSGAEVVQVMGNDTFCIAAYQGLWAAGYDGAITSVSQCITEATREALPGGQLEGISIISSYAIGATDDPSYQLYQAVMDAYGHDLDDVAGIYAIGAYTVTSALATSLEGISGDVTPRSVTQTIKTMPEKELPGGGGATFRCGGSAVPSLPAVCTNQWLRTTLDADGQPVTYEVEDSSDILEGL
jgi:branched-chain amino acid transport system substrate-binding protein